MNRLERAQLNERMDRLERELTKTKDRLEVLERRPRPGRPPSNIPKEGNGLRETA